MNALNKNELFELASLFCSAQINLLQMIGVKMADDIDAANDTAQGTIDAQVAARRQLVEVQRKAKEAAGQATFTHCLNCPDEITDPVFKGVSRFCSVECAEDYEKRYQTRSKQNSKIGQYIN